MSGINIDISAYEKIFEDSSTPLIAESIEGEDIYPNRCLIKVNLKLDKSCQDKWIIDELKEAKKNSQYIPMSCLSNITNSNGVIYNIDGDTLIAYCVNERGLFTEINTYAKLYKTYKDISNNPMVRHFNGLIYEGEGEQVFKGCLVVYNPNEQFFTKEIYWVPSPKGESCNQRIVQIHYQSGESEEYMYDVYGKLKERKRFDWDGGENRGRTNSSNSWIYGTWKCRTPYGTIKVILQEDGRMYDSINEGWFSYTIEGNRIIEKCNGYISTYNIDRANERFDCGEPGVWFYKE